MRQERILLLQDSPPATGRICDEIPYRRSAILHEVLFYLIGISYQIKKRPVLANRTKYTRCTTYYCILTYEFPLTVENRADLLARGFPGRSDASLGVIFHLHPAPGFHHPRLALAFLQIYCLRHRLFLCVTPFYYKDSAKKSQGLGILHFCYFFNEKFAFSFHYCYNVGNDMGYYTRRKYYE